jgi:hypothetical protein
MRWGRGMGRLSCGWRGSRWLGVFRLGVGDEMRYEIELGILKIVPDR